MKKIVVIGMSAASVAFVTKLRSFDKESQIICFSGESAAPYNRCFLADFLTGDMAFDQLLLKPSDFFEQQNVELKLNTWVTKIDTVHKKICAQEIWYDYDILFLGMGTKPFVPKFMQEIPTTVQGLFNFHMLSDMQNLQAYIKNNRPKSALVIGAGLNGIEAASSLLQLGMSVGMIEMNAQILPGQVDLDTASWVADLACRNAVLLITGRKADKICYQQNRVTGLRLDSGAFLPVDMIVVAAGSQINSQLLADTGIALQAGSVLVDQQMRTNIPDVFAAGDLCMVPDMLTGKLARSTTWSDAMLQGLCAATSLSSTPRAYLGMLGLRDSYFFGAYFYACGQTVGHDGTVEVITMAQGGNLKKLYVKDELLIGFVLIGDISKLSDYKKWYATRQKIDRLAL